MLTIVLIVLVVLVVAGWPGWGFHQLGYGPSGVLGLVLVMLLILFFLGRV